MSYESSRSGSSDYGRPGGMQTRDASGGGFRGADRGGSAGLSTGSQWRGNTAYGPAGGMAQGYATRDQASLARAGMAPTVGYYGNFRGLSGEPMYGGQGGYGYNANAVANGLSTPSWGQANQPQLGGAGPVPVGASPYANPVAPPMAPIGYPTSPNIHMSPNPTQRPYNPATSPTNLYSSAPVGNRFGPRTPNGWGGTGAYYSTVKAGQPWNDPTRGINTASSRAGYGYGGGLNNSGGNW